MQVYDEVRHLHRVADSFASDLLLEAVAFSTRKYDFGSGKDAVRARLRDAAAQQDVSPRGGTREALVGRSR